VGIEGARTQFEYFCAFGKWHSWIRGPDGKIIARCLKVLRRKEDCVAAIQAVRAAAPDAPIVLIGETPP